MILIMMQGKKKKTNICLYGKCPNQKVYISFAFKDSIQALKENKNKKMLFPFNQKVQKKIFIYFAGKTFSLLLSS